MAELKKQDLECKCKRDKKHDKKCPEEMMMKDSAKAPMEAT